MEAAALSTMQGSDHDDPQASRDSVSGSMLNILSTNVNEHQWRFIIFSRVSYHHHGDRHGDQVATGMVTE